MRESLPFERPTAGCFGDAARHCWVWWRTLVVAIKRLKAEHTERFKREARAVAALNHPHICQLCDVGPDYLVMEYVEGEILKGPSRGPHDRTAGTWVVPR